MGVKSIFLTPKQQYWLIQTKMWQNQPMFKITHCLNYGRYLLPAETVLLPVLPTTCGGWHCAAHAREGCGDLSSHQMFACTLPPLERQLSFSCVQSAP